MTIFLLLNKYSIIPNYKHSYITHGVKFMEQINPQYVILLNHGVTFLMKAFTELFTVQTLILNSGSFIRQPM